MRFDVLLLRCAPLGVLTLLAAAAYLDAVGASACMSFALVAPPSRAQAFASSSHAGRGNARSAAAILARNPFDSVTGPLTPQPSDAPRVPPPDALSALGDPLSVARCEGIVALIVTEAPDPTWSVAALTSPSEPRPRLRRVGDDLAGNKVEYIGWNPLEAGPAVWLSKDGVVCQTLLFRPPPPASGSPPPSVGSPAPARLSSAQAVPPEIASKIRKVAEREFQLDRAVIDTVFERQAELMGSVRIAHQPGALGIRLLGIRSDTLLGTLGIQSGDRIESVNGFELGTPERALEAFARLRVAPRLVVKLVRAGAPLTLDYEIN